MNRKGADETIDKVSEFHNVLRYSIHLSKKYHVKYVFRTCANDDGSEESKMLENIGLLYRWNIYLLIMFKI